MPINTRLRGSVGRRRCPGESLVTVRGWDLPGSTSAVPVPAPNERHLSPRFRTAAPPEGRDWRASESPLGASCPSPGHGPWPTRSSPGQGRARPRRRPGGPLASWPLTRRGPSRAGNLKFNGASDGAGDPAGPSQAGLHGPPSRQRRRSAVPPPPRAASTVGETSEHQKAVGGRPPTPIGRMRILRGPAAPRQPTRRPAGSVPAHRSLRGK
jgi:hypothetical protein